MSVSSPPTGPNRRASSKRCQTGPMIKHWWESEIPLKAGGALRPGWVLFVLRQRLDLSLELGWAYAQSDGKTDSGFDEAEGWVWSAPHCCTFGKTAQTTGCISSGTRRQISSLRLLDRILPLKKMKKSGQSANSLWDPCARPRNLQIHLPARRLNTGLVMVSFDGNASDMSGNGNHGTVNGASLSPDRHGVAGKAYSFDGVDDFVQIEDHSSLDFNSTLTFHFGSIQQLGGFWNRRNLTKKANDCQMDMSFIETTTTRTTLTFVTVVTEVTKTFSKPLRFQITSGKTGRSHTQEILLSGIETVS